MLERVELGSSSVYNENEVRKILKFNELTENEKKKRYKALFSLPSLAVLFLLLLQNFNYIFISFVVVALILIELIIFGLMDTKYDYTLSAFLKDSLYLIGSSFIVTYSVGPMVLSTITDQMNLSDPVMNALQFFVAMLLLYGTWFSIVRFQSKLNKRSEEWKWKMTGLFSYNSWGK